MYVRMYTYTVKHITVVHLMKIIRKYIIIAYPDKRNKIQLNNLYLNNNCIPTAFFFI